MDTLRLRGFLRKKDDGVALVAAMGVALIGIMFSIVVVTVAIMVTRDSARDRVRTAEIHAAESQLDTSILALTTGAPCTIADTTVGQGNNAVSVSTSIEYFDENDNALTSCTSGSISGTPAWARITSVGTPVEPVVGLSPQRTIQAVVNLQPKESKSAGSAIYSAGSFSTGAGFSMGSVDPSQTGRVWINSGNWTCNTSITIDGDLVVAQGSASFQNSTCTVKGDLWAKTGFSSCCTPSSTYSVWGNLTVPEGGMTLSNVNRFGGNVAVSGAISTSQPFSSTTVVGSVCSGTPGPACSSFESYDPIPMPHITYDPSEWQPGPNGNSFVEMTKADVVAAMATSWGFTNPSSWQYQSIANSNCSWPAWLNDDNAPKKQHLPVNMPSTDAIYDLTSCNWNSSGATLTLNINADTAIFANSIQASNGLVLVSGDGQPHHVYLIVPWGASGTISFSDNGIQIVKPLDVFVYTPNTLQFPNTSETRGQLYAGQVNVGQGSGKFLYTPVPTPGLWFSTTSTNDGFEVQIVNKHEN